MELGVAYAYVGSPLGLLAFLRSILPKESWSMVESWFEYFLSWASIYAHITINEFDAAYNNNEVYEAVELHIATLTSSRKTSAHRLEMSQAKNASKPRYGLASGEIIKETFRGVSFWWVHKIKERENESFWNQSTEKRCYKLTVHKRHRHDALPAYMSYIVSRAEDLKHRSRDMLLYTNIQQSESWPLHRKPWRSLPFKHSASFESMALEPEMKRKITNDLKAFMSGEAFYKRLGRAWKRGYLLHGPPGTGKSSLVAAIANFTGYDIYDLELTEVKSNAELRKLLIDVSNKSIIVIEDIDCSIKLKKRGKPAPDDKKAEEEGGSPETKKKKKKKKKEEEEESRLTLSGLLNFTDGLWSSCGGERIIIFTTNCIEKLDPALLRSGRMDMHILMSYCSFPAFKVLAWTQLELREHDLFAEIEELLRTVEMTPADVAEVLIQNKSDGEAALQRLIEKLKDPTRNKPSVPEESESGESD